MPHTTFHVRRAVDGDAEAISRLTTELGYPSTVDETARRLGVLLRADSHFIAVAEQSSGIVGWVAAERRVLLESGDRAEIVGLIVGAEGRRGGIGSALVQAAEDWATERQLHVISVRSNVTRIESHPFYERLGYIRSKTQHAYSKQLGTD
jgi:GNAT superfamily N-acetyltransferase